MYLYYDGQGSLLEFINDKSLQQYNASSYNTLYLYVDNGQNDGNLPSTFSGINYWFERISGTPIAYGDILPSTAANEQATSIDGGSVTTITTGQIPFDRKRDLKYFVYGKTYQFYALTLPAEVLNTSGVYAMSAQVLQNETLSMVLGPAVFTIKKSALLPTSTITVSQYQYLIAQTRKGSVIFTGAISGQTTASIPLEDLTGATIYYNETYVTGIDVPRQGDAFIVEYETANANNQKVALYIISSVSINGDTTTADLKGICFIDAPSLEGTVLTTAPQTLTAEEQAQVWENLGLSDGDSVEY